MPNIQKALQVLFVKSELANVRVSGRLVKLGEERNLDIEP